MNPIIAMAEAYDFAATKHIDQRRKGAAAEPYMNHLAEVAALVAIGSGGADAELVIAAVLHDTVEDTDTTPAELAERFGPRVAGLVAEVTDDKSLPKAERKRRQVEHAAHASQAAKLIKLADKTSNLRALLASPPADWGPERKAEYVDWAGRVVAGCRGANPWLESQFDAAAAQLTLALA
ncbi:MAG TPA: HD domain-containing protein [Caulobacteraceae bacterium]|jgi:(p)ppGpp synthase/HD superfamily hydrolase|nr:HD domain-containing protein [Caulobacteraceae bacterium]